MTQIPERPQPQGRGRVPPDERRSSIRIPLCIPVKIVVEDLAHEGFCSEISNGGPSFHTTGDLDISKAVYVEFSQERWES